MRFLVRFFTNLREITGKKEEKMEFPEEKVSLDKVIRRLAEDNGKEFFNYIYDSKTGEIQGFLQFLVNGRSVPTLNGLKTELSDGDVLAIIPPVGGG